MTGRLDYLRIFKGSGAYVPDSARVIEQSAQRPEMQVYTNQNSGRCSQQVESFALRRKSRRHISLYRIDGTRALKSLTQSAVVLVEGNLARNSAFSRGGRCFVTQIPRIQSRC